MKLNKNEIKSLIKKSYGYRINILEMMKHGEAHIGGAYSCIDILTVLYHKILKHKPLDPEWENRDRFILSAGHKSIALYVILANLGYFSKNILDTYYDFNTRIPVHPDENTVSGIEFPTGSLGHGLPVANGMALSAKIDNKSYRIFCLLGDGECQEGSIWESIMSAAHYKLENLIVIVDKNGLQVNGETSDIMNIDPLEEKFFSFGWGVKTIDGHDFNQIYDILSKVPINREKPSCIVANTIKCKGLTFGEDKFNFHHWCCELSKIEGAVKILEEVKLKELSKID